MKNLLRQEVISGRSFDTELLGSSWTAWQWLPTAALLVGAISCAFVFTAKMPRWVLVPGTLATGAGSVRVLMPRDGMIAAVLVKEGQEVHADTPVAFVSHQDLARDGRNVIAARRDEQERRLRMLGLQVSREKDAMTSALQALDAQDKAFLAEAEHVGATLLARGKRLKLLEEQARELENLGTSGFASKTAVQNKQAEVLAEAAEVSALHSQRAAIEEKRQNLRRESTGTKRTSLEKQDELSREASLIREQVREAESLDTQLVVAGAAGMITNLKALGGQRELAGADLATVLPAGQEIEARLEVPMRALAFFKPGDMVDLRYDAYPFQFYGAGKARVYEVSSATNRSAKGAGGEPHVIAKAKLQESKAFVAKPLDGMTFQAVVELEPVRIMDWVMSPLRR